DRRGTGRADRRRGCAVPATPATDGDAGRRLGLLRRLAPPAAAARARRVARLREVRLMADVRRLVLGSASPARLSLLRQAGLSPEVVVSDVDESTVTAPRVGERVALLASAKATAVARREEDALVIGADSLLEFRGEPLG